jgi:hypothetical protein
MCEIEYSDEVKAYFLDSGDLAFGLLRQFAELMITPNGLPLEGYTKTPEGLIRWETPQSIVFYERIEQEKRLIIAVIKPK